MSSFVRKTISVLATTAATAFAVYVLVTGAGAATESLSPSTSVAVAGTQVCPDTGCTALSCHATDPAAPGPDQDPEGDRGDVSSDHPSLDDEAESGSESDDGLLVCPDTGCAASSCHATDPAAPGPDQDLEADGGDAFADALEQPESADTQSGRSRRRGSRRTASL